MALIVEEAAEDMAQCTGAAVTAVTGALDAEGAADAATRVEKTGEVAAAGVEGKTFYYLFLLTFFIVNNRTVI